MKTKNGIKRVKVGEDILRPGKLGYTASGRMNSTIKRLESTFSDSPKATPGKKYIVECPACGRRFKSNNGKIPDHLPRFAKSKNTGNCHQIKDWRIPPKIEKELPLVEINTFEVRKGDAVAFTTYPNHVPFQDWQALTEHNVAGIYLMDNGHIYLKLKNIDEYVPVRMFVRNFIKL